MRHTRLALLAAVTAAAVAAGVASAAPAKPLLTDPAGDVRALGTGYDIVSADLHTTGKTVTVKGKKVYTPTKLLAVVTMAGPVATQAGTQVSFYLDTSACGGGSFEYTYTPGNTLLGEGSLFVSGCGSPLLAPVFPDPSELIDSAYPVVAGNTITWTLDLKEMGSDLPLKSTFTNARVYSDFGDPVLNLVGTQVLDEQGLPVDSSLDVARSSATYTLK